MANSRRGWGKTRLPGPNDVGPGQQCERLGYSAGAALAAAGPRSGIAPRMAAGSGLSSDTTMPDRNDSVMVIRQGFLSGKYHHCFETSARSCLRMSTWMVGPQ